MSRPVFDAFALGHNRDGLDEFATIGLDLVRHKCVNIGFLGKLRLVPFDDEVIAQRF
jgi:hypothetical protein